MTAELSVFSLAQVHEKAASREIGMFASVPIENVVFSGGGAKGAAYAGAVLALEAPLEHSQSDESSLSATTRGQIKSVSGSSVGAMTAALFATGMSGKNFEKAAKETDMDRLGKDGTGNTLLKVIRNALQEALEESYQYYKNLHPLLFKAYGITEEKRDEILNKLESIRSKNNRFNSRFNSNDITFQLLHDLHELDPKRFKDLSISGLCVNSTESQLVNFNYDTTPTLEIALACRASASIPFQFEAVKIKKGMFKNPPSCEDDILLFIDGGYKDNLPVDFADQKQEKKSGLNVGVKGDNLQTLIFLFDETEDKLWRENKKELKAEFKKDHGKISDENKNILLDKLVYKNSAHPKGIERMNRLVTEQPRENPEKLFQSPYLNAHLDDKKSPALYKSKFFSSSNSLIRNFIPKWWIKIKYRKYKKGKFNVKNTEEKAASLQRMNIHFAQRVIPLKVYNIGTTDFTAAKKYADVLVESAYNDTLAYLKNHAEECSYQSYRNVTHLLLSVDKSFLKEIQSQLIKMKIEISDEEISFIEKIKSECDQQKSKSLIDLLGWQEKLFSDTKNLKILSTSVLDRKEIENFFAKNINPEYFSALAFRYDNMQQAMFRNQLIDKISNYIALQANNKNSTALAKKALQTVNENRADANELFNLSKLFNVNVTFQSSQKCAELARSYADQNQFDEAKKLLRLSIVLEEFNQQVVKFEEAQKNNDANKVFFQTINSGLNNGTLLNNMDNPDSLCAVIRAYKDQLKDHKKYNKSSFSFFKPSINKQVNAITKKLDQALEDVKALRMTMPHRSV